jgi:hypothetical protein
MTMPKYLVRCDAVYSKVVEADSEEAAIAAAPPPPSRGEWDDPTVAYEAEEYQ